MTHDEMIAVIQAHKAGKNIQWRHMSGTTEWETASSPAWDFSVNNYRIAPENVVWTYHAYQDGPVLKNVVDKPNLKLTFDGETGELKSAEVL